MPVTNAINYNADNPVPPDGHSNVIFQSDGSTPLANVTAFDPLMVGDAGSGGWSGNVPAPPAGSAAAGQFLRADGTWAIPAAAPPSPTAGWSSGNNSLGFWVKDPLGHIRQWGNVMTDINGGTLTVTFPTPFTDASSVSVVATARGVDRVTYVVDGSVTTGGFTIGNNGSSYAFWQADGY